MPGALLLQPLQTKCQLKDPSHVSPFPKMYCLANLQKAHKSRTQPLAFRSNPIWHYKPHPVHKHIMILQHQLWLLQPGLQLWVSKWECSVLTVFLHDCRKCFILFSTRLHLHTHHTFSCIWLPLTSTMVPLLKKIRAFQLPKQNVSCLIGYSKRSQL